MSKQEAYLDRWMPTPSRQVRVVCRPSTDRAFSGVVDRAMAASPTTTMAELEYRLRMLYPAVQVRADEIGPRSDTWRVYRDGGPVAQASPTLEVTESTA